MHALSDLHFAAILPRIVEGILLAAPKAGWTFVAPGVEAKSTLHVEDVLRSWPDAASIVDLFNGNGGSFKPTDVSLSHTLRPQELADQVVLIDSDANLLRITQVIVSADQVLAVPFKMAGHFNRAVFILVSLCKPP